MSKTIESCQFKKCFNPSLKLIRIIFFQTLATLYGYMLLDKVLGLIEVEFTIQELKFIKGVLWYVYLWYASYELRRCVRARTRAMCGRTCVVCDQLKNARPHAHRTHVLEVFSHTHAHVQPNIARVRARTHLPFATHTLVIK